VFGKTGPRKRHEIKRLGGKEKKVKAFVLAKRDKQNFTTTLTRATKGTRNLVNLREKQPAGNTLSGSFL